MPSQVVTSPLSAALKAHAKDPVEQRQDFSNLPGGIINGIAVLREARIGEYKPSPANNKKGVSGQKYLFLSGSVIEPKIAYRQKATWDPKANNGKGGAVPVGQPEQVNVFGLFTRQTLPLCPTKRKNKEGKEEVVSLADNTKAALNELKLIGGERCCDALYSAADPEAVLNALLEGLKKANIHFKFGTDAADPTPEYPNSTMVFERWYGAITPGANGQMVAAAPSPAAGTVDETANAPASSAPGGEAAPADAEQQAIGDDLAALLELANTQDDARLEEIKGAQDRLHELAQGLGIDQEWREAPDTTWEQIVEAIQASQAEGSEGATPAEPVFKPAVGETYPYKVIDGKTKRSKNVNCEVKKVDEAKQTVDLLSTVDKKTTYKGVAWDKLIRE